MITDEIKQLCNSVIQIRQEIDIDNSIYRHTWSDAELSELNGQCRLARKILRILESQQEHNI